MKIRILSDLHLESLNSTVPVNLIKYNGEDLLILAGDIDKLENLPTVFKQFLEIGFPKIIHVPGNHEYYRCKEDFSIETRKYMDMYYGHKHVFTLYNEGVVIDGINFLGTPLWSSLDNEKSFVKATASRCINDFKFIKSFTVHDCAFEYYKAIKFLRENRSDNKTVIVTHFLPSFECVSPKYRYSDDTTIKFLNHYFANDLDKDIVTLKNTTWIHGHTHDSVDVTVGTTRIIANPKGYGTFSTCENVNFNPNFTIEV